MDRTGLVNVNLCNVRWSTESSLHNSLLQGAREFKHTVIQSFTAKGGVAVIANQLAVVARTLITVRQELAIDAPNADAKGDFKYPSTFMVNGLLASAITGLQNVLDAVASVCHNLAPDSEHNGIIYFSTYSFAVTEWDFIARAKHTQISKLKFDGLTFNELANRLKHELPWVGVISQANDINDVYDSSNVGAFRGMLVPMYNIAKNIVCFLGNKYNQSVDLPFV